MNPYEFRANTAVFRNCFASPIAVETVVLSVLRPRITSSSFMTLAGLKKCNPITFPAREVTRARVSISSDEGFDARIASGCMIESKVLKYPLLEANIFTYGFNDDIHVA